MMHYDEYRASDAAIDALLDASELARLITVAQDGVPELGLYPFYRTDGAIHLHLNRGDPQLVDLARADACLFEVDEVLATIPSYWVDPENARMATAYHRCASFTCRAQISEDKRLVAEGQQRILQRYQPEGGYRPVLAGEALYAPGLAMLAAVTLRIVSTRSKFKLAQNQPPETRRDVAARLRTRGRLLDERAAEALADTLGS